MALDWKCYVSKLDIDSDGYDDNGCYWGVGCTLWQLEFQGNQATGHGNGFSFTETIRGSKAAKARAYSDKRYSVIFTDDDPSLSL